MDKRARQPERHPHTPPMQQIFAGAKMPFAVGILSILISIDDLDYAKAPTSFNIDKTDYRTLILTMTPEQEHEHEREKNQKEFRAILEKYGLTQAQAAALITEQTYRPIQSRTVRTWLANADAVSARNCPTWAVVALKRATEKLPPVK